MFRFWSFRNKSPENSFSTYRNQSVRVIGDHVEIGGRNFLRSDNLDCGDGLGSVPIEHIAQIMEHYSYLTSGEYNPQLAVLIYAVTNIPQALDLYFPIVSILDEQ